MTRRNSAHLIKFAVFSLIGVFLFLVPIPSNETFTIPVGILIDLVKSVIHDYTLWPLTFLVVANALLSLYTAFKKPQWIMDHRWLRETFVTTPLYLISRVVGAVIIVLYATQTGPDLITGQETGGTMIDLARSLMSILIVISYTMPFLTEFGIMEFVGVLVAPVVRPLFLVPGRSAVDLITSWLGASNAAVLLTKQQYDKGFYTGREAAIIMTNFSLVSIPFCYIVADILQVTHRFTAFYLITTAAGILMAVLISRIPPLRTLSQDYGPGGQRELGEELPPGKGRLAHALDEAARGAEGATAQGCLRQGTDMLLSVIFGLSPIIIAWGTAALLLVEHTEVFNYLSYPLGWYMNLLGIEGAFEVAPATLVGFADMFIPPLLLTNVASEATRFIVGSATLLQLIYMTETGAIMLQSQVPLDFKDLVIIFLERTLLALALVTLLSRVFLSF
ncbi:MAG: YjiH family protein [Tissierellia bacterium]|nr:YjiH family protein [Tissierellia bacterium]